MTVIEATILPKLAAFNRVMSYRHRERRSGGKAIAGPANIHGVFHRPRRGPCFPAFFDHQRALGTMRYKESRRL